MTVGEFKELLGNEYDNYHVIVYKHDDGSGSFEIDPKESIVFHHRKKQIIIYID